MKSSHFFLNFAAACLLVITLLIGVQVFLRNFFLSSIPDYIQIAEIFIALTIFFPLIGLHSEHIRINFFFDKFSQKTKRKIDLFSMFTVLLISIFIAISAWNNLLYQWDFQNYFEGDLNIPRWLPSLFFFIILFSFAVSSFLRLVRFFLKRQNGNL